MNKEQWSELHKALLEFVIRATKEGATPEEVEVLPKVAQVLLSIPIGF